MISSNSLPLYTHIALKRSVVRCSVRRFSTRLPTAALTELIGLL